MSEDTPTKKRVGRPRKSELKPKRGRGRPKGDAAIINEYKRRMIASPKSRKVLDKIFETALDDEHKHQAVCLKLCAERLLPVKAFEQDVTRSAGTTSINITIGEVTVEGDEPLTHDSRADLQVEAVDAEFTEVEECDTSN